MRLTIVEAEAGHWEAIRRIYAEGIATGHATFATEAPDWAGWDRDHLPRPRLAALVDGEVAGWAALSPVSGRCVYEGVAEVSVYVGEAFRGRGVGGRLLRRLVEESEGAGIWTLQAGIFPENRASLELHRRAGFRRVGVREKLGRLHGRWRDVVLLERRAGGGGPASRADGEKGDAGICEVWSVVGREVEAFRDVVRELPVMPARSAADLREEIRRAFDLEAPSPLEEVTARAIGLLREGSVHVTSPRYFGLFNPSVLEAGILADTLAALYNLQLAAWSHAPAAIEMEVRALALFTEALGLPREGSHANFTSGGAEANLSAVLAALAHRFPEWSGRGVAGLRAEPVLYLSSEAHHSFLKVARITGLGTEALAEIPVGADLRMDVGALERRVEADARADRTPLAVVATAGTTGTGAIDPLPEVARVAEEAGAWFHVDAAWGGAAALSPRLRPLLDGIERADSVTWDAHKWLSVPMGAGMFFCRHREAVERAFAVTTGYMPPAAGKGRADPYNTTAQWSRRAIGLKVFLSLAQMGRSGYGELIERQAALGNRLRGRLEEEGWIVVNRSPLPVVCFTHPDFGRGAPGVGEVLERIYRRRRVWISEVSLPSRERALRACITSYRTDESDLEVLIEELEAARARDDRG